MLETVIIIAAIFIGGAIMLAAEGIIKCLARHNEHMSHTTSRLAGIKAEYSLTRSEIIDAKECVQGLANYYKRQQDDKFNRYKPKATE